MLGKLFKNVLDESIVLPSRFWRIRMIRLAKRRVCGLSKFRADEEFNKFVGLYLQVLLIWF
ncbi:MAG: hypothetical protein WA130_08405 [Candidatus Methanoperedens sp.]